MQSFGRDRYGPKMGGGLCPFGGWVAGSPSDNVARADAYPHAEFHLDPSRRLATMHERHRQVRTDRQTDRQTGQRSEA